MSTATVQNDLGEFYNYIDGFFRHMVLVVPVCRRASLVLILAAVKKWASRVGRSTAVSVSHI